MAVREHKADKHFCHDPASHLAKANGCLIVYELLLRFCKNVEPQRSIVGELRRNIDQRTIAWSVCLISLTHFQVLILNWLYPHCPRYCLSGRQLHPPSSQQIALGQRRWICGNAQGKI